MARVGDEPIPRRTRRLGRLCIGLFVVSASFPITASIYSGEIPRWLALADVTLAALLLSAAVVVRMQTHERVSDEDRLVAFRISQIAASAIPALLLLFFIAGRWLAWDVLMIGLAWRGWLLLYSLPYLVASGCSIESHTSSR